LLAEAARLGATLMNIMAMKFNCTMNHRRW